MKRLGLDRHVLRDFEVATSFVAQNLQFGSQTMRRVFYFLIVQVARAINWDQRVDHSRNLENDAASQYSLLNIRSGPYAARSEECSTMPWRCEDDVKFCGDESSSDGLQILTRPGSGRSMKNASNVHLWSRKKS